MHFRFFFFFGRHYLKVGSVVLEMLLHTYTQLSNPLPLCLQGSSVGLSESIAGIKVNKSKANNTPKHIIISHLAQCGWEISNSS